MRPWVKTHLRPKGLDQEYCLAFSRDGRRIVTLSFRKRTLGSKGPRCGRSPRLFTLKGHTGTIHSSSFSPDGRRIVAGSDDTTARVWDATDGRELLTLKGHGGGIDSAAFSTDGTRIVIGTWIKTGRVWDAASGKRAPIVPRHPNAVHTAVVFSPDGQRLLTLDRDGNVAVWDATSGRQLLRLKGQVEGGFSIAVSPDSERILTGGLE